MDRIYGGGAANAAMAAFGRGVPPAQPKPMSGQPQVNPGFRTQVQPQVQPLPQTTAFPPAGTPMAPPAGYPTFGHTSAPSPVPPASGAAPTRFDIPGNFQPHQQQPSAPGHAWMSQLPQGVQDRLGGMNVHPGLLGEARNAYQAELEAARNAYRGARDEWRAAKPARGYGGYDPSQRQEWRDAQPARPQMPNPWDFFQQYWQQQTNGGI